MTDKQLSDWITNKFELCYPVKHKNYKNFIFWYYDELYIRKKKLCKLNNEKTPNKKKVSGVCLFAQELKNRYLFCDTAIFYEFYKNYNTYESISLCIMDTFKNNKKLDLYNSLYLDTNVSYNTITSRKNKSIYKVESKLLQQSEVFEDKNLLSVL